MKMLLPLFIVLAACCFAQPAQAGPICVAPYNTFAAEIAAAEVAVVAKFVKKLSPDQQTGVQRVEVEVVDVFRGEKFFRSGDKITWYAFSATAEQPLVLLSKEKAAAADWSGQTVISPTTHQYLKQVVKLPAERAAQLKFYWQYLEDSDDAIRHDAYDQFNAVPYEELKANKALLNHDQLVKWIRDSETPASRRRLYLLMLSRCGSEQDVPLLEGIMNSTNRRERAGFDAVLLCYLSLRGDAGLPAVEELLKNPKTDYADVYSAVMALRFHHSQERILKKERVGSALKLVLQRRDIADLVIPDLIALQDWSVADELFAIYKEAKGDEQKWVRVPIIQYLRACPLEPAKAMLKECEALDPAAAKRVKLWSGELPAMFSTGSAWWFRC